MERVEGIGGVFFRSKDPQRLAAWYAEHLGIAVEEWGGSVFQASEGAVTVWSPFAADTDYWPAAQQAMVNYRVRDLDALLAQLRAAGVEVDERVEETTFLRRAPGRRLDAAVRLGSVRLDVGPAIVSRLAPGATSGTRVWVELEEGAPVARPLKPPRRRPS